VRAFAWCQDDCEPVSFDFALSLGSRNFQITESVLMRYEHCIDPGIDIFSFNKLMFAGLDDAEAIDVIVSAATLDVVVVVIADFSV